MLLRRLLGKSTFDPLAYAATIVTLLSISAIAVSQRQTRAIELSQQENESRSLARGERVANAPEREEREEREEDQEHVTRFVARDDEEEDDDDAPREEPSEVASDDSDSDGDGEDVADGDVHDNDDVDEDVDVDVSAEHEHEQEHEGEEEEEEKEDQQGEMVRKMRRADNARRRVERAVERLEAASGDKVEAMREQLEAELARVFFQQLEEQRREVERMQKRIEQVTRKLEKAERSQERWVQSQVSKLMSDNPRAKQKALDALAPPASAWSQLDRPVEIRRNASPDWLEQPLRKALQQIEDAQEEAQFKARHVQMELEAARSANEQIADALPPSEMRLLTLTLERLRHDQERLDREAKSIRERIEQGVDELEQTIFMDWEQRDLDARSKLVLLKQKLEATTAECDAIRARHQALLKVRDQVDASILQRSQAELEKAEQTRRSVMEELERLRKKWKKAAGDEAE